MNLRSSIMMLLAVIGVFGCKKISKPIPESSAATTPHPDSNVSAKSAGTTPQEENSNGLRAWSQAEIEQVIRDEVHLTEVSLKKGAGDSYTGTGRNADVVTFTLSVRYRPGEIKVTWTSPGRSGNGSYHWVAEGLAKQF